MPIVTGNGGSSSAVEKINGENVTVADATTENLTWDTPVYGPSLVDLTDPTEPVVVGAGVYIVTAQVDAEEQLSVGALFVVVLSAARTDGTSFQARNYVAAADEIARTPGTSLSLVADLDAGSTIDLAVSNHDGASARLFRMLRGVVAKVS